MSEAVRGRDRERTEAAILAAAEEQLAEAGFQAFGVNAVARRAGCDKQLIYRYYGGLEGLAAAVGQNLGARYAQPPSQTPAASYGELTERLLLAFLEQFRADRLAQRMPPGKSRTGHRWWTSWRPRAPRRWGGGWKRRAAG